MANSRNAKRKCIFHLYNIIKKKHVRALMRWVAVEKFVLFNA